MTLNPPIGIHIYWYLILDYTTDGYVVTEFVLWCTSTGWWNTVHWRGCTWAMCIIMVLFHNSGTSRSYHSWIIYMWIPSCTRFYPYQRKSHENSTRVMGNVGCLIIPAKIPVGCLEGSVLKVDLYGEVKKKITSGFVLQVMLRRYLCV